MKYNIRKSTYRSISKVSHFAVQIGGFADKRGDVAGGRRVKGRRESRAAPRR